MQRPEGFRGEFLWEFEIAERQILAIAQVFPGEKYSWRPDPAARSVAEVLVHVAAGTFMLLDFAGLPVPTDLYGRLPAPGPERMLAFIRMNDELGQTVKDKSAIVDLLKRALNAARESFTANDDVALARPLHFFGEHTTVRRAWLRLLVHTHEHMGQLIGYLRCNGIPVPWPDWRPDRR